MKVVLAAALCLVLGAAPAPAGEPTRGEIVLTGDSSASAELRLDREVRLACCRLVGEESGGPRYFRIVGFEVETTGSYAGFAIERKSDGRILTGAVRLPAMDLADGTVPTYASFGKTRRLAPGRYRIHLLTDGPSTVRIAAAGLGRDLDLRPEGPAPVTASLVELSEQDVEERVAVEVPEDATVVLVGKTEGDFAQAHYLVQCLAAPGDPCFDPVGDYDVWTTPASGSSGGTNIDLLYGPPAGSYEAVFASRSLGVPQETFGFVLVLG